MIDPLKAFSSAVAQMPEAVGAKMRGTAATPQGRPHVAWLSMPRCPCCHADLHPIWENMDVNCPRCLVLVHVDREETVRYRSSVK